MKLFFELSANENVLKLIKINNIISKVLNRLYTPDSILKLEDPVAYANRQYHLEQVKSSEKALLRMVFPVHQYFEPVQNHETAIQEKKIKH